MRTNFLIPGIIQSFLQACLAAITLMGLASIASASLSRGMTPLEEEEMAGVTGAGLAIAAHDFAFLAAPTSYIWVTGRNTSRPNWQRGDLIYYGTSWSGGQVGPGMGTTFSQVGGVGSCNQGDPVGCPLGTQGITNFASVLNPYVFRVYQYPGFDYQGTSYRTGNNMPNVMELIGPSRTDNWRWAFWGEIIVGLNDVTQAHQGILQSQTIINGSPTTLDGRPAVIRYMRTQQGTAANPSANGSFGIIYESALSGDFRFSVGQVAGSPNQPVRGIVPNFDPNEGMYFRNVDAYIPVGRMHYQTIQLDTSGTTGDFRIFLTSIPNNPNIYNEFYCGNLNGNACATVQESLDPFGNAVTAIAAPSQSDPRYARWRDTQGYVRWGDFNDIGNFSVGPNGNGIMFVDRNGSAGAPNPARNNAPMGHMGVSRIEGLRIQSMTLTTLGAGGS